MTTNINLLPWREEQQEIERLQFIAMMAVGCVIALAIVVGIHFLFDHKLSYQNELNGILKQEITVLDSKIAEINELEKEKQRLLARMAIIQELQGNRPHVVRLFDNLVRTIPDGLYLVSLTREGQAIAIQGKAESNTRVSKFMRNIESSDWLSRPLLNVIKANDENDSQISFTLQAIQVKRDS